MNTKGEGNKRKYINNKVVSVYALTTSWTVMKPGFHYRNKPDVPWT